MPAVTATWPNKLNLPAQQVSRNYASNMKVSACPLCLSSAAQAYACFSLGSAMYSW